MDLNSIVGWVNVGAALLFIIFAGVACMYIINYNDLEFNAIWGARLALVVTGVLWAATAFMHSEVLWGPESGYAPLDPAEVPALCRSYVVLKYGLLEPIFFLLVLNIVKFMPGDYIPEEDGAWFPESKNVRIFFAAFSWWLPYWLIQAGFVTVGNIPFASVDCICPACVPPI